MKRHHRRHSGYLLIALVMIGVVFVHRHDRDSYSNNIQPSDDRQEPEVTIESGDTITISKDNATTIRPSHADHITSGASFDGGTIVIVSKSDANTLHPPSSESTKPMGESTAHTGTIQSIIKHQNEIQTTETSEDREELNTSGDPSSGYTGDTIVIPSPAEMPHEILTGRSDDYVDMTQTGTHIADPKSTPVFTTVTARSPLRTPRQGKQFAYELANALEIGTGMVLTSIDGYYETQTLYDARQQTQDTSLYGILVDRLEAEHRYDDMLTLLADHTDLWTTQTAQRYIHALRESTKIDVTRPETIQTVQDTLYRMEQTAALSTADIAWQQTLIATWSEGVDKLIQDTALIAEPLLRKDIHKVIEYYDSQANVPLYYRDALIAMALVQHEHFALAEKIATQVLIQDPQYILPLQVLAYSSFTQRDRDQAGEYLSQLTERDPDQSDLYNFLRGVVTYWQGDYAAAALMLRQTQNPRYLPDAVRYLALAYDHLGDVDQRDAAFGSLLQYTLDPSDYYTYFYLTFYQPFQEADQTQYDFDPDTAKEYVSRCTQSLHDEASVVCRYGAAGVYLAYGQLDRAYQTLLELYDEHHYSYLARALGDYYTSQDDTQTAIRYYFQALRTTDSSAEQSLTKQKIRNLTQDDS